METKINFNGVDIPDFVKVVNIEMQLMGEITNTLTTLEYGAKLKKREIGSRIIKLNCKVIQGLDMVLNSRKIDDLIEWLKGDLDNKASKLFLPNDPRCYYEAILYNTPELINDRTITDFTIEFLCLNPNRIEENETCINPNGIGKNETIVENIMVIYEGTSDTYPIIEFEVISQCEEIKLSVSNSIYNNYVRLRHNFVAGNIVQIDMKTKKVTIDGVVKMSILTLDSNFHKLVRGQNYYTLESGNVNFKIRFKTEYM